MARRDPAGSEHHAPHGASRCAVTLDGVPAPHEPRWLSTPRSLEDIRLDHRGHPLLISTIPSRGDAFGPC